MALFDPIEEEGETNPYVMVGNNLVSQWDFLGLKEVILVERQFSEVQRIWVQDYIFSNESDKGPIQPQRVTRSNEIVEKGEVNDNWILIDTVYGEWETYDDFQILFWETGKTRILIHVYFCPPPSDTPKENADTTKYESLWINSAITTPPCGVG